MDPNEPRQPSAPAASGALSHRFIEILAPVRDRLYTLALARAASPAAAESALQAAARKLFQQYTSDPHVDLPAAMTAALTPPTTNATPASPPAAATGDEVPMPADAWARLAAAVQFEAASSANSDALHPDSVLLQPDPLLAPKKTKPRTDDAPFDVASSSRLLTLLAIVVLTALLITLYILTRPAHGPVEAAPGGTPPSTAGAP